MASECKLTPPSAWLMIYRDKPTINWYACCVENIKAMRFKLKVISYGSGGLPELTNYLSAKAMATQAIFAELLVNEVPNEKQYKLINLQWIGSQLRFMAKAKIAAQIDSILNEFPVRHLEIKLNETKLDLISPHKLENRLNSYRGPYKVKYNFIVKCYHHNNTNDAFDSNSKWKMDCLLKQNENLQAKVNELSIKLAQKQQEIDLLILTQRQQNVELKEDAKDFCVASFHLFMDRHIKVDEIKKSFLQNAKYNDIRMMIYLDADILNEIGINSKIFIKIVLNECKQLIEAQTEFINLIGNKKYSQLFNNKGILTVEHFETFLKKEEDLKHVIGIKHETQRQQIWRKLESFMNNDNDALIEGHNTDYY